MSRRRDFLRGSGVALTAFLLNPVELHAQEEHQQEVSPVEDLMREHGLLNRVLLLYEACGRRLAAKSAFDPAVLNQAAGIIRDFIEGYHEKLEEQHLFPRFEKAGKLTDLVGVLRKQHAAGRNVTARILQSTNGGKLRGNRRLLMRDLYAFSRMYRPHEAREDTVLFPALRSIVSTNEYGAMGEDFEKKEHELFGKGGFEEMVEKITGLEKTLGTYDLARFTPA